MPGSDDDRTITGYRTASKLYRRPPGWIWWLALLAVPLLIGLVGWSGLGKSNRDVNATPPSATPTVAMSSPTVRPDANTPGATLGALSIVRSGNGFTLIGDVPDAPTKAGLADALRGAFPGVKLTDNLNIRAGVTAPDAAALGGLFGAGMSIPNFAFDLKGDTVTLTGTAPSEEVKADVETASKATWPNVKVVNNIEVRAASAAAAPQAPAPTTSQAPAPGGGPCANLQSDITGLLRTPINFATDGFSLTGPSQHLLKQVAGKLAGCPNARVAVVGHTDNTGNDAINVPLSGNRAKSVADYLVSQGVAGDHVTSKGVGSTEPVASNSTADGRAQNRRVAIVVS